MAHHGRAGNRPWLVRLLQEQLERQGWPRLQMALLVALTGGAGLLASFLLLQAGVLAMGWRYPLALAVAYLVFLALLWLWLRTSAADYVDAPGSFGDVGPLPDGGGGGGGGASGLSSGGGGDFAGGGASASFDTPDVSPLSEGVSSLAEADEFALPLVVLALAVGLALSSLYVVYTAPLLFAELLLDGALAATLYHRLRGLDTRHWIDTALRRTAMPFLLTAIFLAVCGVAMQWYAPQAHTLGEVLQHAARS